MTQREQLLTNALISLSRNQEYLMGIIYRNICPDDMIPNDLHLIGECRRENKIASKNWEEFNNRDCIVEEAKELSLSVN